MKILILAKAYPPSIGGVENYSHFLAEGLARDNSTHVLTYLDKINQQPPSELAVVRRIKPLASFEAIKAIQLFAALLGCIRRVKPEIIVATTWKVAFPFSLIKWILSTKMVIVCHGAEITRHKDKILQKLSMRFAFMNADKIICVSAFTKEKVLTYTKAKDSDIVVIPNGIDRSKSVIYAKNDARQKLGFRSDDTILLTVARVDHRKGHQIVIESVADLVKKFPKLKYVIVGKGPRWDELKRQVNERNLSDNVLFAGYVDSNMLGFYYSACDLFIMLNTMKNDLDFEGFGLVFVEAAFYKKPSVAGKNAGPMEIIDDRETGYLIETTKKDTVELLSNILGDKSMLNLLGEQAFLKAIDNYDIELMIMNTRKELDKLLIYGNE